MQLSRYHRELGEIEEARYAILRNVSDPQPRHASNYFIFTTNQRILNASKSKQNECSNSSVMMNQHYNP